MKSIRIEITESDINFGGPDSPNDCPVARALRRACPDFQFVYVGQDFLSVSNNPRQLHQCELIDLPEIARRFVQQFDESGDGEPIGFEVQIPDL